MPDQPSTATRRTVGGYPAGDKTANEMRPPPTSVSRLPDRPQVVTWEDTTNIAAWQDADDIAAFARDGGWRCQNVGWVVHEDDECIVLAARRAFDEQAHVGLAERIPKRAIVAQEEIRLGDNTDPSTYESAAEDKTPVNDPVAKAWAEGYQAGWEAATGPHPMDCRCKTHRPDLHIHEPFKPTEKWGDADA